MPHIPDCLVLKKLVLPEMPVDMAPKTGRKRKDPPKRKGTAPQDRKPLDNYYSAPATYHRKKTVASVSTLPAKSE